jgi:hypothetical protein
MRWKQELVDSKFRVYKSVVELPQETSIKSQNPFKKLRYSLQCHFASKTEANFQVTW